MAERNRSPGLQNDLQFLYPFRRSVDVSCDFFLNLKNNVTNAAAVIAIFKRTRRVLSKMAVFSRSFLACSPLVAAYVLKIFRDEALGGDPVDLEHLDTFAS